MLTGHVRDVAAVHTSTATPGYHLMFFDSARVFISRGYCGDFLLFTDNLMNISYVPLCSIASTFSFTYLLTHSPILGLFCCCDCTSLLSIF